jgi:superfamily I DNA/RNA helicase
MRAVSSSTFTAHQQARSRRRIKRIVWLWKGRQFEAVVIPELVQEVFPAAPWVERQLKQERRLFYVAFTSAKKVVALVYGDQYRKRNNSVKQSGVSQFVLEVDKRLNT